MYRFMIDNTLLSIGEAANMAGVSIQTLRRWDKSGKLVALKTSGGQRRYHPSDIIRAVSEDLLAEANAWATADAPSPLTDDVHCATRATFEARLQHLNSLLETSGNAGVAASLIVAAVGELGNNSFDHNLGSWRDVPGVYFNHDLARGIIVLADRGQGLLATLRRVRPGLTTPADALRVGFTEVVTGRAPEKRGNGLKLVRRIAQKGAISLAFQTGDARLSLSSGQDALDIAAATPFVRGTLTSLTFTVMK